MLARRALLLARLLPSAAPATAAFDQVELLRRALVGPDSAHGSSSSSSSSSDDSGGSSGWCSGARGCGTTRSCCTSASSSGGGSGRPGPHNRSGPLPSSAAWRSHGTVAAAAAAAAQAGGRGATAGELPLWRFLRQCGFSAAGIDRMRSAVRSSKTQQKAVTGKRFYQQKVARDLAPNIAALLGEGLDTAAIERLYVKHPALLNATHRKFTSALEGLRRLVALLPDKPCAAQAPAGATQLGAAVWRYPGSAARLLLHGSLASLIDGNLQLRQQLGVIPAQTARSIFQDSAVLATDLERAEAMAAHLLRLQASGELSAKQVAQVALKAGGLALDPAEFDRRRREGGAHALQCVGLKDPAGRQQAAAAALGELLQAADGVPGQLQQRYRQQGDALVQRCAALMRSCPASLRASWAALRRAGLTDGDIAATVQHNPVLLTHNWEGEAKQRLAAWLHQELGLSLAQFVKRHAFYAGTSVGRLAMRAACLRQRRPERWEEYRSRGTGSMLSLLADSRYFFPTVGYDEAELAAFEREWLQTPEGRRWGSPAKR